MPPKAVEAAVCVAKFREEVDGEDTKVDEVGHLHSEVEAVDGAVVSLRLVVGACGSVAAAVAPVAGGVVKRGLVPHAEGVALHLNRRSGTGYLRVSRARHDGSGYVATGVNGSLGSFQTAEAAAAAVSRHLHQLEEEEAALEQQRWHSCWVACDACNKWRLLLDVHNSQLVGRWRCSESTDPLHRRCDVPQAPEAEADEGGRTRVLMRKAAGWKLQLLRDHTGYEGVHQDQV